MANLSDGFKDIFLAGIGAMAITGEKTKELVDQLISKGELTVDQGKQINSELKHKANDVAKNMRYDVLQASMAAMTPEERAEFAAKAAELAEQANAKAATEAEAKVGDATAVEVDAEADADDAAPACQTPGA